MFGLAHRNSLTELLRARSIDHGVIYLNDSDMPTEQLLDLSVEYAARLQEREQIVRNHYLGVLATQIERADD